MATLLNITDEFLIGLAGKAAYSRGKDYFQSGQVLEWHKKGNTITAKVAGTETWQVVLKHTKTQFEGYCDCPASNGFDFCKHCVAVSLLYRQESEEQAELAGGSARDRIQAYLLKLDKKQLQESLLELIDNDRKLRDQWSLKADLALDKVDQKAIRKRITAAFPYNRNIYTYTQARSYFAKAGEAVALLEQQIPAFPADKSLALIDYALQRLNRALQTVDDSGGFRLDIMGVLHRLHVSTLQRADWDNETLVTYIEKLEFSDFIDVYPEIPGAYDSVLGEEGRALYLQRKRAEWNALPPLTQNAEWDQKYHYQRVARELLKEAVAADDSKTEIDILEKSASTVQDCVNLCERLIELDKWGKAEHWLATARKWRGDRLPNQYFPDSSLDRLQLKILLHHGEISLALKLQWKIYQLNLTMSDYQELMQIAELDDKKTEWNTKVYHFLIDSITSENTGYFPTRNADHLLELYIKEDKLQKALDLAAKYTLSTSLQQSLIDIFKDDPDTSIPLYKNLVNATVSKGDEQAYREAVELVHECRKSLKTKAQQEKFIKMVEAVREKNKAKRNFMKLLAEDAL